LPTANITKPKPIPNYLTSNTLGSRSKPTTAEILSSKFAVKIDQLIGTGNFGEIHKGTWNGKTVAVKTKPKANEDQVEEIFDEIDLLKYTNILQQSPFPGQ
jgi:hypothetical protein